MSVTTEKKHNWLKQELEYFVEKNLPALVRLEFFVEHADENSVLLSAPLSANFNDKGTAFGGSQYMLALSSAWSLAYMNMVNSGEKETQFVIAKANIEYLRPTTSEKFYAYAKKEDSMMEEFLEQAKNKGRGKATVCAEVFNHDPRYKQHQTQKGNSKLKAMFALTID